MTASGIEPPLLTSRTLAEGPGWRATDVICLAGPSHRSSEEQFGWTTVAAVVAGTFTYRCGAGQALMVPNTLLLGQADTCFECGHDHGTGDRCVAFQFAPEYVEDVLRDLGKGAVPGFTHARIPAVLPLLSQVRAFIRTPVTGAGEEIALDILTQAYVVDKSLPPAASRSSNERRISDVVRLVESCYADRLTLAALAARAGLGRRRFATVFRHVTGVTPYQYIINHRLNVAAQRLEEGEPSVLAVALDVGFGDLSEFTRAFRLRFGVPPATFRRGFHAGLV